MTHLRTGQKQRPRCLGPRPTSRRRRSPGEARVRGRGRPGLGFGGEEGGGGGGGGWWGARRRGGGGGGGAGESSSRPGWWWGWRKPSSAEEDPPTTTARPSVLFLRERKGEERAAEAGRRQEGNGMERWTSCPQMGLVLVCSAFSREMRDEMGLSANGSAACSPLSLFVFVFLGSISAVMMYAK
jgi:hypothetical protein